LSSCFGFPTGITEESGNMEVGAWDPHDVHNLGSAAKGSIQCFCRWFFRATRLVSFILQGGCLIEMECLTLSTCWMDRKIVCI